MASEISEEKAEDSPCLINTQAQKDKVRRIIEYQKCQYYCSSSSTAATASCSSYSSSRSSSLLELMKEGSTSLRRLFDMEHTSLENHLKIYSGSPVIKPIPLWGSDTDDGAYDDPWSSINQIGFEPQAHSKIDDESGLALERIAMAEDSVRQNTKSKKSRRKLIRTKSFRRLPRFSFRCRGFRFRTRLRIMVCGTRF